jgi:phosphoglycerate kinase
MTILFSGPWKKYWKEYVNGEIIDDYRIASAIPTIKYILDQKPHRLILTSHYGRPKNKEKKYSMEFMIPILNKYLNTEVTFLKDGLNNTTLEYLDANKNSNTNNTVTQVYLLENLRFNLIETLYENLQVEEYDEDNHNIIKNYRELGDVFILDAFGCLHRKHMSIYDIHYSNKIYGYGDLIEKELENIDTILSNKN